MTTARRGAAIAAVYVAVAIATSWLSSRPTRPLFDGFAPPVPYNWVKPPPELASTNRPPQPAERSVTLLENGSEPANASTADAQIIVTMPAGAVAANPPDASVTLRITPLDATTLAPPPAPLRIVSNAYRVALVYQPSQIEVAQVSPQTTIALTAGTQGDTLLYSPAGEEWQQVASRPFGGTHGVTGTFSGPGYYLVAASPRVSTPITTVPQHTTEGGGSGGALIVTGVVAIGAIATTVVVTTRNRRAEERRQAEELRRRQRAGQHRRKPNRKKRS